MVEDVKFEIQNLSGPLGTPYGPSHRPTIGSLEGAVSDERGTPVGARDRIDRDRAKPPSSWRLTRNRICPNLFHFQIDFRKSNPHKNRRLNI